MGICTTSEVKQKMTSEKETQTDERIEDIEEIQNVRCITKVEDIEPHRIYRIKIKENSVYDGDTIKDVQIFVSKDSYIERRIRMYGYDSFEIKVSTKLSDEERKVIKDRATRAKKRLEELLDSDDLEVYTMKNDKYGRLLAVISSNGTIINNIMIDEKHGYPYVCEPLKIEGNDSIYERWLAKLHDQNPYKKKVDQYKFAIETGS